jgi:hypothetical protein
MEAHVVLETQSSARGEHEHRRRQKVFDTETMWNRVRGPMGTRCARLANPTWRRAMTCAPRVTNTTTPARRRAAR